MTLAALLEEDRERFVKRTAEAGTPERAVPYVTSEIDSLLLRYNESENTEECREAAGQMLSAVRAAVPLLMAHKEANVWERAKDSRSGKTGGRAGGNLPALCFLLLGCVLLGGAAFSAGGANLRAVFSLPVVLILMILGILSLAFSGFLLGRPKKGREKDKSFLVEQVVDAEKIYRTLRASMLTADQNLKEIGQEAARREMKVKEAAAGALPDDELSLLSDLLEASMSGDSEYAFERLSDIRYYLHRHHIEVMEYTEDTARWFDRMPSTQKGTLKPALVSEGKLLKKGICGV